MSTSLILGILLGLAIGGPLYYAYKVYTLKRKHVARRQLEEMMRRQKEEEQKKDE